MGGDLVCKDTCSAVLLEGGVRLAINLFLQGATKMPWKAGVPELVEEEEGGVEATLPVNIISGHIPCRCRAAEIKK